LSSWDFNKLNENPLDLILFQSQSDLGDVGIPWFILSFCNRSLLTWFNLKLWFALNLKTFGALNTSTLIRTPFFNLVSIL
jgi:hypothetical protein